MCTPTLAFSITHANAFWHAYSVTHIATHCLEDTIAISFAISYSLIIAHCIDNFNAASCQPSS